MKKLLLPASVFPTLIFVSCQKEITGDKEVPLNCRIIKGNYIQSNLNDSAQFLYDDWGRVIKWKNTYGYYDYLYSGENIQVLTYKNNVTSDLLYLDSISYNLDNTVSDVRFNDYTSLPYSIKSHRSVFVYDQHKLSSIIKIDHTEGNPDSTIMSFTWNSAGNIDRIVSTNKIGTVLENITFQYNSNPNYFKEIHPQFFLFDPQLGLDKDFEWQMALFWSANNVVQVNRNGVNENVLYYFNHLNQLTGVEIGSNKVSYSYECH